MVLTPVLMAFQATSKDGKDAGIELIQPPPGSKPGERIYFEGANFESKFLNIWAGACWLICMAISCDTIIPTQSQEEDF